MRKYFAIVAILAVVAVLTSSCAGAPLPAPILPPTPTPALAGEVGNFRLLISDEVNAIEDFEHLHTTISRIGVHPSGEGNGWIEYDLDPEADLDGDGISGIDLTVLQGDNATQVWSGNLIAGQYDKVFIYVYNVTGMLAGAGETEVNLPSGKLQISKPFTISDFIVNFVFDITVVEAGKSDKYIFKPQIAQSGPDKPFNLVIPKGKPETLSKPEKPGKPEKPEKPDKP